MDSTTNAQGPQGPARFRFACIRCDAPSAEPGTKIVGAASREPGRYATVCPRCVQAAEADPSEKRKVEHCTNANVSAAEVDRVFAPFGGAPTTREELSATLRKMDAQLGLPPGTMERDLLAMLRKRG